MSALDKQIRDGNAVDVTVHAGGKAFEGIRLAVATDVWKRFVLWGSYETRAFGMYLEEDHRLQKLIASAAPVITDPLSTNFVHRAVCTSDVLCDYERRFLLELSHLEGGIKNEWLIGLKS